MIQEKLNQEWDQVLKPDGHIRTRSMGKLSLLDPKPEQICIEDIAAGLAFNCHFGGQIPRFFSIAEHSMMVAEIVPQEYKLLALLHDASEAYLGDMKKPLKELLPEFKAFEDLLTTVILVKFGCDPTELPMIKPADKRIQLREYHAFYEWGPALACMPPEEAYDQFLELFYQLQKEGAGK